ncbi:hypothetical protein [Bacillus thuringiensis]|nr:hypothetical protein [Bacillus thuringiensis]
MSIETAERLALFTLGLAFFVELFVLYLLITTDERFRKKKEKKDEDQKR